jgi:hypothetical protein
MEFLLKCDARFPLYSKWNEENWKRQLSEKDLQAALRTNKRLENEMQSLRLDNKALRYIPLLARFKV